MRLIDADALLQKGVWTVTVGDIKNAPTIDLSEQAKRDIATIIENEMDMRVIAERKHGKWEVLDAEEPRWYGCSECKKMARWPYNYCPNCGARMDGE